MSLHLLKKADTCLYVIFFGSFTGIALSAEIVKSLRVSPCPFPLSSELSSSGGYPLDLSK
jgi:hypothetical protein